METSDQAIDEEHPKAEPVRTVECPQCTARWYGDDCREECVICHVPTAEVE